MTIVIKALNEERRIVEAVESALRAVSIVGGEVVLADSCSTDRTVDLASRYPIRIVQLKNASERCCGIGPQLGYQHARGDYIYILDGDMQMFDSFLPEALAFMDEHPDVGGVGGLVVEMNTESLEYKARVERAAGHMRPGAVDRLDMGGLYRREAVADVRYFSDRNLHSYEELDLALRLRAKGWKLWRLGTEAVRHHGHDAEPYALLRRRWTSGYICGLGELVRASWGQPQIALLLRDARELKIYIAVLLWMLVYVLIALWPMSAGVKLSLLAALVGGPVLAMSLRKKSMTKALFSIVSWFFNSFGLVKGILRKRQSAEKSVASLLLSDGVVLNK